MKLLMLIVNEEYQHQVSSIFTDYECSATIIASTGDFLKYGDTIFLLGIEEDKAVQMMQIMKEKMGGRVIKDLANLSNEYLDSSSVTIFCIDIHHFVKTSGGVLNDDWGKERSTRGFSEESTK